jgi:hypothetical protein
LAAVTAMTAQHIMNYGNRSSGSFTGWDRDIGAQNYRR